MDLKANFNLPFSIAAQDKFGNPTSVPFDAPPSAVLSDASLGALTVAGDGLSGQLSPSGKLGSGQIQASASIGGKSLSGSLDVNVIAGDPASIQVVAGTPVAQ